MNDSEKKWLRVCHMNWDSRCS